MAGNAQKHCVTKTYRRMAIKRNRSKKIPNVLEASAKATFSFRPGVDVLSANHSMPFAELSEERSKSK